MLVTIDESYGIIFAVTPYGIISSNSNDNRIANALRS
jgi:hypothetical protein